MVLGTSQHKYWVLGPSGITGRAEADSDVMVWGLFAGPWPIGSGSFEAAQAADFRDLKPQRALDMRETSCSKLQYCFREHAPELNFHTSRVV